MELYVHLPFCARKCRYCDFASYAGQTSAMPTYVDALLREAAVRADDLNHPAMKTFFLGGGTPSLLPAPLLDRLLAGVFGLFPLIPGAEATSEANPGTLTADWLDTAVKHGIMRLSMGMQAYQPELLNMLGRIHTFRQVEKSVALARAHGMKDISLDLMFGLPVQTLPQWLETLDAALSLHPQHLSCYGLIPEEGTPLTADLEAGRLTLPNEDTERTMYDEAIRILGKHGFRQYEISNFALPGHECRHNLGYWQQTPYLGLGASASSMLMKPGCAYVRETNPPGLHDYMAMVQDSTWPQRDCQDISCEDARFETMMLGLRTTRGVSEADFAAMHGISLESCYGAKLADQQRRGLLLHENGRWSLTRRGMDVQNAILVELMED